MTETEFEGQREGEKVELVFRKHLLTTWRGIFGLILMSTIGFIPLIIWHGIQGGVTDNILAAAWEFSPELIYLWLAFIALGLFYALNVYMKWYFSYYLVTNQRLRQVAQHGLFRKEVTDWGLDRILSIKYKTGILGGLFSYGTLTLQTQASEIVIAMVRQPQKIYNTLQNLASQTRTQDE